MAGVDIYTILYCPYCADAKELLSSKGVSFHEIDATGKKDTFSRINDLRDSYQAAVLVVTGTNEQGKAPPGQTARAKIEYWDYWRAMDIGAGNTAKEFVFVEMNSDTGWFQIWRGREFFA